MSDKAQFVQGAHSAEGQARARCRLAALLLATVAVLTPAMAQETPNATVAETSARRAVRVEGTIHAPVREVWRVWTTSEGAEEFFAQKANIELRIGGPYEIQFDPKDERSGTKGLKILSYAPEEMISFQWNAPPEMPEVRNGGTWVVVEMRPEGTDRTHVTVTHLGWKQGLEWDQAYVHFQQGWSELMQRLERRFTDGPIDWNKEPMMYQQARSPKQ
ncbi:MAG TPA: SRPBCC domain-containing protein [Candidatus Eisenbacteria bacterium]|nr:SRPBCC domain-containing protein [Candidatus Eisenbacteria bacterium]